MLRRGGTGLQVRKHRHESSITVFLEDLEGQSSSSSSSPLNVRSASASVALQCENSEKISQLVTYYMGEQRSDFFQVSRLS